MRARWLCGLLALALLSGCELPQNPLGGSPAEGLDPSLAPAEREEPRARPLWSPEPPAEPIVLAPQGRPPEAGWPIAVLMHGYRSNHRDLLALGELARSRGLLVISPPAPEVSQGEERYYWRRWKPDHSELYVRGVIAEVRQAHPEADPEGPVWLAGFSQGGLHASWMVTRHPKLYAGALAISPAGWVEWPEAPASGATARRIWLARGAREPKNYAAKTEQVRAFFAQHDMLAGLIEHDGGHHLPPGWPREFAPIFEQWSRAPVQ